MFVLVPLSGAYNTGSHCKCATFGSREFSAHSTLTQPGGRTSYISNRGYTGIKVSFYTFWCQ